MIYAKLTNAKEEEFLTLLEKTKLNLLCEIKNKKMTPLDFENIVFKKMCDVSKKTCFEDTIQLTGAHAFPDIIANNYFGVEVKLTVKDQWVSTGNSVLESTRISNVERIYIMFAKLGGNAGIKYRLYQECLPEISVTHSPRYKINMELSAGETIFDKLGVDYDDFRKETNPISRIKEYYRSKLQEGEEMWWIDKEESDKTFSPIILPFRKLSENDKNDFIINTYN